MGATTEARGLRSRSILFAKMQSHPSPQTMGCMVSKWTSGEWIRESVDKGVRDSTRLVGPQGAFPITHISSIASKFAPWRSSLSRFVPTLPIYSLS